MRVRRCVPAHLVVHVCATDQRQTQTVVVLGCARKDTHQARSAWEPSVSYLQRAASPAVVLYSTELLDRGCSFGCCGQLSDALAMHRTAHLIPRSAMIIGIQELQRKVSKQAVLEEKSCLILTHSALHAFTVIIDGTSVSLLILADVARVDGAARLRWRASLATVAGDRYNPLRFTQICVPI